MSNHKGTVTTTGVSIMVHPSPKGSRVVQAWSPLRKALSGSAKAACEEIGKKYGKSPAQVCGESNPKVT